MSNLRDRRLSVCASDNLDPDDSDNEEIKQSVKYPKSDNDRKKLRDTCLEIFLFQNLDKEELNEVISAIKEIKVKAGQVIIKENDYGNEFYLIDQGKYVVEKNGETLFEYTDKGYFGELALMYDTPRTATVKALSNGRLWSLPRKTFRSVVLKKASNRRKQFTKFVQSVSILQSLSQEQRMKVADALGLREYQPNSLIFQQGTPGQEMFFVIEGKVSIRINKEAPNNASVSSKSGAAAAGGGGGGKGKEEEINIIEVNDYFGERALVKNEPRAASAYAIGNCKLACLDRAAFERLLGPCDKYMKRRLSEYETKKHKK